MNLDYSINKWKSIISKKLSRFIDSKVCQQFVQRLLKLNKVAS
ncbi:hypothetical protein ALP50_01603 [Pseudomonas syringae pv. spinaceae]|nr:Unknown protein sequence [Pseudomonas syringae pv. maculicola str. M6]KPB93341.1 Unknown protein sequence [Pseudomonas syringae pv. maculicola]RMT28766.1 hypothetical protein ALP50_01603 [Pseudomonas syringae pv. spinaceae]